MATLLCAYQEPGNTTWTHKELVLYKFREGLQNLLLEKDTADPKERQHAQLEPGKASHSQLLMSFLAERDTVFIHHLSR